MISAARTAVLSAAILLAGAPLPSNGAEAAGSASALTARFENLRSQSDGGPFGIPLFIESSQTDDRLSGAVHSRIDQPFDAVRGELGDPRAWCEILILHPNVKGCTVDRGDKTLAVRLGSAGTPARFGYRVAQSTADYLDVRLSAAEGPFGTTDYSFRVEATPLDAGSTLLHLAYAHNYGMRAKLALQTYFNTFGRGKVGFTVVDRTPEGKPIYVDQFRGGLERNAMRYYLAIQAHLEALGAPAHARLEKALQSWLARTERYPLQLGEEPGFLERKRSEIEAFRSGGATAQASG